MGTIVLGLYVFTRLNSSDEPQNGESVLVTSTCPAQHTCALHSPGVAVLSGAGSQQRPQYPLAVQGRGRQDGQGAEADPQSLCPLAGQTRT